MQPQSTANNGGITIKPQLAQSALALFESEAASQDGAVGIAYSSLANAARTGACLELSAAMRSEVILAIRWRLGAVSQDGDEPQDWRYLSDIAALACAIEEAVA